jgi:hypothetical protein
MILEQCLHGLCTFPNMVSNANIARNFGKNKKKKRNIMYTVVDNVGVVSTWSVRISKYGN